MAYFKDLASIDYFGEGAAVSLRAVGWLSRERPFQTGPTEAEVFVRLSDLCVDPMQPVSFAGVHSCDLCQFRPEASGSDNLFVPAGDVMYVAPVLILHYVNVHWYQPPREFCAAVLSCPDMRTREYRKQFLRAGGGALLGRTMRDDRGLAPLDTVEATHRGRFGDYWTTPEQAPEREPWISALRRESIGDPGSFLTTLRTDGVWNKSLFDQLLSAMRECCRALAGAREIPREIAELFWYLDWYPREEIARVPDAYAGRYYENAVVDLNHLAFWLFTGETRAEDEFESV